MLNYAKLTDADNTSNKSFLRCYVTLQVPISRGAHDRHVDSINGTKLEQFRYEAVSSGMILKPKFSKNLLTDSNIIGGGGA